jgi:hypothetical protein
MPSLKNPSKPPKSKLSNTYTTARDAKAVLSGRSKKNWIARLLPFLGPAFIASIAYVDPGNFATNIQGYPGQQLNGHASAGFVRQAGNCNWQKPG